MHIVLVLLRWLFAPAVPKTYAIEGGYYFDGKGRIAGTNNDVVGYYIMANNEGTY